MWRGFLVNDNSQFTSNNHQHFIHSHYVIYAPRTSTLYARQHGAPRNQEPSRSTLNLARSPRSPSPGAQRVNSREPRGLLRAQARSSLNREPMASQPWGRDTRLHTAFLVVVVASGLRRADAVAPHAPHAPHASMAATAARRRKWRASHVGTTR